MKKSISIICVAIYLTSVLFVQSTGFAATKFTVKLLNYKSTTGVGIFYPQKGAKISGIAKIYGLAYAGEGWLDLKTGIAKVKVTLGVKAMYATMYVKNHYWIRTFDSKKFKDGALNITVTAYDKKNKVVGTATDTITIDNKNVPKQRRYYAATYGKYMGDGSVGNPWDVATALEKVQAGDILFIRGGTYYKNMEINNSGKAGKPITIMNYPGEKVQLKSAGIDILRGVQYVNLMGINQSGVKRNDSGLELGLSTKYIEVWDCSFNSNTHPYDKIPQDNNMDFGTGFISDSIDDSATPELGRQYITVSHCEAKYNDVDGFQLSNIDHGRFQYLESAWNPNNKVRNIFQYKHANGFAMDNGEGVVPADNAFLYCYSHHNGQDGFDIADSDVKFIGCITHDESHTGFSYGGEGMKLWSRNYSVINSLDFNNNLVDGSGAAMGLANKFEGTGPDNLTSKNLQIYNTLFYNTKRCAVAMDSFIKDVSAVNNIFYDFGQDFDNEGAVSSNSIFYGTGEMTVAGINITKKNPKFINAKIGNFFLTAGSPALTLGNSTGLSCIVDGVDYMKYDGLGRPRVGKNEVGPYTRYK